MQPSNTNIAASPNIPQDAPTKTSDPSVAPSAINQPDVTPIQNKAIASSNATAGLDETSAESSDQDAFSLAFGSISPAEKPRFTNATPEFNPFHLFLNSLGENALSSTNKASAIYQIAQHKAFDEGTPLTGEQRKELQKSFPDFNYPEGIDSTEAQIYTTYQSRKMNQEWVDAQAHTFWQKSASYLGSTIGQQLDAIPLAGGIIAASLAAPEEVIVGGTAVAAASALAISKAAPFVMYGAGSTAANEMVEAGYDYTAGQKYNTVEGLKNMGLASAMAIPFAIGSTVSDRLAMDVLRTSFRSKASDPGFLKNMGAVADYNMRERFPAPATVTLPDHTADSATDKVEDILKTTRMVSPEDDATLQKLAMAQLYDGQDVHLDTAIQQAMFQNAKVLRNRLGDEGIPPKVVSDSVVDAQNYLRGEMENTGEQLKNVNDSLANIPEVTRDQQLIEAEKEHLANNDTSSLYKSIGDVGVKLKSNIAEIKPLDDLRNLQDESKRLNDKLTELHDSYALHEYIRKALNDELESPNADALKEQVRYNTGATIKDSVYGEDKPEIKDLPTEQEQIMHDLNQTVDDVGVKNLKSSKDGAEAHNSEVDESEREIEAANRRVVKLPDIIKAATNCVWGSP